MTIIPFATNSYTHDAVPLSAQRVLNMYAEAQPPNAKTQVSVHGVPGIVTYAEAGVGPIRGFALMGGLLYVVSGARLYSVSSAVIPVVTLLGTGISGSGIVSIADNGDQLMIVNGTNGYVYSTDAGFQLVTDSDFHAANTTTFLDSFFLFNRAGTGEVFRSDLLDGTAYDATAFATAEAQSDNVLAVRAVKQLAYVFGERTTEPWGNIGSANFPFAPLPGGAINRGIIGSHAHAEEDEGLFILGNDRIGYRLSGTQLSRNSTHAIERAFQKYVTASDAFGMAHSWNGHKFITFTFPTQSVTWVYDISTQLWHERESRDRNGTPLGRWRANCIISAYGKTFVGDAYSGKIGYLSDETFTEFDDPLYASATGSPLHANGKRLFMSNFALDMETGVGLTSGQGLDPQVMLDISDDGGRTWSAQQPWQSLGVLGAYKQRLRWKKLGSTEPGGTRVMRVTISDPVRRTIVAANADVRPGT